jgi:hypothetical protein
MARKIRATDCHRRGTTLPTQPADEAGLRGLLHDIDPYFCAAADRFESVGGEFPPWRICTSERVVVMDSRNEGETMRFKQAYVPMDCISNSCTAHMNEIPLRRQRRQWQRQPGRCDRSSA